MVTTEIMPYGQLWRIQLMGTTGLDNYYQLRSKYPIEALQSFNGALIDNDTLAKLIEQLNEGLIKEAEKNNERRKAIGLKPYEPRQLSVSLFENCNVAYITDAVGDSIARLDAVRKRAAITGWFV